MVILPLELQPFHPTKKKNKKETTHTRKKQTLMLTPQKITVDHPQQELGVDKILNSGCGHAVKSFVE